MSEERRTSEVPKPSQRGESGRLPIRGQALPPPPPLRKGGQAVGLFVTTHYHLLEGGEFLDRKPQPAHVKSLPGNRFPWVPLLNPKHPAFPGGPLASVAVPKPPPAKPKLLPTPKKRLPRKKAEPPDRDRSRSPKPAAPPPKKARPSSSV